MKKKIVFFIIESCFFIIIAISSILLFPNGKPQLNDADMQTVKLAIEEFEPKDMNVKGNVLTASSDDSWLAIELEEQYLAEGIYIKINEMSVGSIRSQIFYDSTGEEISGEFWVNQELTAGENLIAFPENTKVKVMRLDLTDQNAVVMNIGEIALKIGKTKNEKK